MEAIAAIYLDIQLTFNLLKGEKVVVVVTNCCLYDFNGLVWYAGII